MWVSVVRRHITKSAGHRSRQQTWEQRLTVSDGADGLGLGLVSDLDGVCGSGAGRETLQVDHLTLAASLLLQAGVDLDAVQEVVSASHEADVSVSGLGGSSLGACC